MEPSDSLSIGDLARRTGLSASAIRFYETKGLLRSVRNAGGHRRFQRADIRRLSFVLISQRCGFTIREIRAELEKLPSRRTPTKADWTRIGRGFRQELDRRIGELTRLRDRLDGCIGCGCLSLKTCTLYNPEDVLSQQGTGPRLVLEGEPRSDQ